MTCILPTKLRLTFCRRWLRMSPTIYHSEVPPAHSFLKTAKTFTVPYVWFLVQSEARVEVALAHSFLQTTKSLTVPCQHWFLVKMSTIFERCSARMGLGDYLAMRSENSGSDQRRQPCLAIKSWRICVAPSLRAPSQI
jgi:hypothetical protein